jgi:hypothetical protein
VGEFNQLLAQRYNAYASRLLGIAEGKGISQVAPEVMPIVDLETDKAELEVLRNVFPFIGTLERTAAGAGQFSQVGVFNPSTEDSPLIVVITRIVATCFVTSRFEIRQFTPQTFDSAAAMAALDLRVPRGSKAQIVGFHANPANGVKVMDFALLTNTSLVLETRFVLRPQTGIFAGTSASNQSALASFQGYERPARPEETTGALGL